MESNVIWVIGRELTAFINPKMLGEYHNRRVIGVSGSDYFEYQRELMILKQEQKGGNVCIFDAAVLKGKRAWKFVRDGINKAGMNPMRGLGTSGGEQFIDVSNLYNVPGGEEGVVINSLGERFEKRKSLRNESCADMQMLAIVAHGLDFRVYGVALSCTVKWDIGDQLFFDLCGKYGL